MKAYEGDGKTAKDIPADYEDDAETARMELIEAAAEGEDALLMKYLEGEELSSEEILRGLSSGCTRLFGCPGLCGGWLSSDWPGAAAGRDY